MTDTTRRSLIGGAAAAVTAIYSIGPDPSEERDWADLRSLLSMAGDFGHVTYAKARSAGVKIADLSNIDFGPLGADESRYPILRFGDPQKVGHSYISPREIQTCHWLRASC